MIFLDKKINCDFQIWYILIDPNEIFPMKPSKLKISISVESYEEKLKCKMTRLVHTWNRRNEAGIFLT